MVKYANKPKGRPSKRKTLKTKYKIERKVKQHHKRVRREARRMKDSGLKHKGETKSDYLPNMFPFKQQMLDEAKRTLPKTMETEVSVLDKNQYGVINIESKCQYLPKPKDNLVKKYVTNLEYVLSTVKVVLELLDSKNPQACIDKDFRQSCLKQSVPIITVLTKTDTVSPQVLQHNIDTLQKHCTTLICFSTEAKRKQKSISDLMVALQEFKKDQQLHQILVAGKTFTGKHSLITLMAKAARCYQIDPIELLNFKLDQNIYILDSPYKINDSTENPMFTVPNPVLEEIGLQAQEEQLLRNLCIGEGKQEAVFDRDLLLEHFSIQDFTTVSDLVNKIGRGSRFFGKGGSIDTVRTRTKVIGDWFCGRLNRLIKTRQ